MFCSDPISLAANATEEIVLVLAAVGSRLGTAGQGWMADPAAAQGA